MTRPRRAAVPPAVYFTTAGVLALTAVVVAVYLVVLRPDGAGGTSTTAVVLPDTGAGPSEYSQVPSPSVFSPIDTRASDAEPLSADEVFTKTLKDKAGDITVELDESRLDRRCATAVWGEKLAGRLRRAGCTQAARALYTDERRRYAAAVTIFNLADVKGANAIVKAIDPKDGAGFPRPLAGKAPLDRFGRSGFSAARGLAMGHYAVVTWVQRFDEAGDGQDETLTSLLVMTARPQVVLDRAARKSRQ